MFMPGCWCCSSCTIFTDDFSTDRTGTDYTVSAGSWTVSGGVLTTGSTGALIVANSSGPGKGHASVDVTIDTNGGSARLCAYTSDTDYLFVELTINGASSTLKLWKKVSNVDSQLSTTYTFTGSTSTVYTLELCWTPGDTNEARGSLVGTQVTIIGTSYSVTHAKVALGASPNGGTVTFDNLSFKKNISDDSTCPRCQLPCCRSTTGSLPNASQLLLTLTNDSGYSSCTGDCAGGGPTLPTDLAIGSPGSNPDYSWTYDKQYYPTYPSGYCNLTRFRLNCEAQGTHKVTLGLWCFTDSGGTPFVQFATIELDVLSCDPFHATGSATVSAYGVCWGSGNITLGVEVTE